MDHLEIHQHQTNANTRKTNVVRPQHKLARYVQNIFVDANNRMIIAEGGTASRIRGWQIGADTGTVIAGGINNKGNGPEQLDAPGNAFIDVDGNFYISDMNNFRVQK